MTKPVLGNLLKILVIEDNPGDVFLIHELLKNTVVSFEMERAASIQDALDMAGRHVFDAILLDLGLPDSFGVDTLRKFNAMKLSAPVIILTGLNDEETAIASLKEGAQDYLVKSNLTGDNIIRAIRYGIERKKLVKEITVAQEALMQLNRELDDKIRLRTQELARYASELKELNAKKDKFFGIIAHDLKNPLSSLIGASELLITYANNLDRENIRSISRLLNVSAHQGYLLLENLLEWSMTQTGMMEFHPAKADVNQLIEIAMSVLKNQAENKEIELKARIEANLEAEIDKSLISSVLRNLLTNAIKFTPRQGKIMVRAHKINNHLEISVKDNGIGIPPEIGNHLFDIDVTFSREGTEQEKGSGLGLLLCREFVEKHGGKIRLESKPGEGTKITFTLPVAHPKSTTNTFRIEPKANGQS
jgi:signal transduction histidine kinase